MRLDDSLAPIGDIEICAEVRSFLARQHPQSTEIRMSLLDENSAILRQFVAEGRDLSYVRLVDFSHIFPDFASANGFAAEAAAEGFKIAVGESNSAKGTWDVTASKVMPPSADAITESEARLSALAERHQGYADGWGFLNT